MHSIVETEWLLQPTEFWFLFSSLYLFHLVPPIPKVICGRVPTQCFIHQWRNVLHACGRLSENGVRNSLELLSLLHLYCFALRQCASAYVCEYLCTYVCMYVYVSMFVSAIYFVRFSSIFLLRDVYKQLSDWRRVVVNKVEDK